MIFGESWLSSSGSSTAHKLFLGDWCEELVAGEEEAAEAAGTGVNPEADIVPASGAAYQPYHHNVCGDTADNLSLQVISQLLFYG